MVNNTRSLPTTGDGSALRRIWPLKGDFIADLLSYGLSSRHYVETYGNKIDELAGKLISGTNFTEAAHELCYTTVHGIVQDLDPALVMLAHEGTKRGPRRAHPHRCDGWR
ncbi:hypothetical protein [Actinomadura sp. 6N118]|uniref:hypothetical protein n=1 Tax=Actinomadura sp. 6N118 TaxID=3375151 RepID=UPI0037890C78